MLQLPSSCEGETAGDFCSRCQDESEQQAADGEAGLGLKQSVLNSSQYTPLGMFVSSVKSCPIAGDTVPGKLGACHIGLQLGVFVIINGNDFANT